MEIGVLLMLACICMSEAARGIIVPSIARSIFAQGGTVSDVGVAISLFSLGRLVAVLPCSYWAVHGSTRGVVVASCLVTMAGSWMYTLFSGVPGQVVPVLVSRFVVGCGSGTLGACRGYIADNTDASDRIRYVSYAGLAQFMGFSLAPWLGDVKDTNFARPGYILMAMNLVILVAVWLFLKDSLRPVEQTPIVVNKTDNYGTLQEEEPGEQSPLPTSKATNQTSSAIPTHLFYLSFWVFFFLNLNLRGMLADVETLGPIIEQQLHMKLPGAVEDTGRYFFILGMIGCVTYFAIEPGAKCMSEHVMLLLGVALLGLGSFFFFIDHPNIQWFTLGAVLVWCISSPICQTLTISTFSKMLGEKPQATYMGYLTFAGSLGRIVYPVIASRIDDVSLFVWHEVNCLVAIALCQFTHWMLERHRRRSQTDRI